MQARKNTHRNTPTKKVDQSENNWWIRGRFLILIFFKTSLNSPSKLLLMTVFTSLKEDASELCSWARYTASLSTGSLPSAASWRKPVRRPAARQRRSRAGPHRPLHRSNRRRRSTGPEGASGLKPRAAGDGTGNREQGEPGEGKASLRHTRFSPPQAACDPTPWRSPASPRHRDRAEGRHRGGRAMGSQAA